MAQKLNVRVLRVYEDADSHDDGTRVLVDRLWPRGLAKADAALDAWEKDVAPSTELRKWYEHDPEKFEDFGRRYRAELATDEPREALRRLRKWAQEGQLTLLTAVKEKYLDHGHTVVLVDVLREAP